MSRSAPSVSELEAEFATLSLCDARLNERARRIVSRIAVAPEESFPKQMASEAEREALYRFLANPEVSLEALLLGHVEQTHARMQGHRVVRIVHDTTKLKFSGDREGLGIIARDTKGFFAHTALAVGDGELREPLGVVGVRTYVRKGTESRRGLTRSKRSQICQATPRDEKVSSRWEKLAVEVSRDLPAHIHAIHVMDQEADDYALLGELHKAGLSFVVRGEPDRRLARNGQTVRERLAGQELHVFRTISVTARSKARAKATGKPERAHRDASLSLSWGAVTLQRASRLVQSDVEELPLYAVHVTEPEPPAGEEPIEWMLFTSEPVRTLAEAIAVVDHYRARWMIEEYFKALKTGCAFEKRQLTTFDGLERALGLFVPVAWKLLVLRYLGRRDEPRAATTLLTGQQLLLLHALLEKRGYSLPKTPTVREAMLGIASLGGHIRNNGDPGWIVLGRGWTRFVEAEEVWTLASRSDQS